MVGSDYKFLKNNLATLKKEFNYNKFENVFPDDLTSFKTDLKAIYNFTDIQDESKAVKVLHKKISAVAKNFKKFNFVVNYNAKRSTQSFRNSGTKNTVNLIYTEVDTLVRNFNEEFYKLKRFKF